MDYVSHKHRLKVPLIRLQNNEKTSEINGTPDSPLKHIREATWEEALDFAALGFSKILKSDGFGSLAGFGSAKGSNEEAYLFQKLIV